MLVTHRSRELNRNFEIRKLLKQNWLSENMAFGLMSGHIRKIESTFRETRGKQKRQKGQKGRIFAPFALFAFFVSLCSHH